MLGFKAKALALGGRGEDRAARFLESKGLKIMDRGYQTRWGEVDLIAKEDDTWVFIEVKTRTHGSAISPLDVITPAKQKRVVGAALSYMKKHRLIQEAMRFDVIAIEADRIEWIPGAFGSPEPSYHY